MSRFHFGIFAKAGAAEMIPKQSQVIQQQAGVEVMWHALRAETPSANAFAGVSARREYDKRVIRVVITYLESPDKQAEVGGIANERVKIVAPVPIGYQDIIEWQGRRWRIESDSRPSRVSGSYEVLGIRAD